MEYLRYFAESVQLYVDTEYGRVYDGISLDQFKCNYQIADDKIISLQEEINKKIGIKLDIANFCALACFVNTIVRERYYMLLKPTIVDTLEEIGEVSKITFDGKVSTTNTKTIEAIVKAMKEQGDDMEYEFDRIAKAEEIEDISMLQSRFVYYLASFLRSYFPDAKRRANCCMVSLPEQRLILHLLSYFKLAPEGLTDSRFRQLIRQYKPSMADVLNISGFGSILCTPIKYKGTIQEGDTVKFTSKK